MPHGTRFLAYRTNFYVLLSAKYGLPYLPDAARSFMLRKVSSTFNQRTQDATRAAVRVLEGMELRYDRAVAQWLDLSVPNLRVPLLLTTVLATAGSRRDIIDEARSLSRSSSASKLRRYLDEVNSWMAGDHPDYGEAVERLAALVAASEEFYAEFGRRTPGSDRGGDSQGLIPNDLLSIGSSLLLTPGNPVAAIQGALKLASDVGRTNLIERWLLRRQLLFLRDPVAIGRGRQEVDPLLERHFGRRLSGSEWSLLLEARGLSAARATT